MRTLCYFFAAIFILVCTALSKPQFNSDPDVFPPLFFNNTVLDERSSSQTLFSAIWHLTPAPPPYILWSSYYNHIPNAHDEPVGLAISPEGNVWVTGMVQNLDTSYDFYTIIYAPDGNPISEMLYDGSSHKDDIPSDIIIDSESRSYVLGQTWVTGSQEDYLLIRYDQSGSIVWEVSYDDPLEGQDIPVELALDSTIHIGAIGSSYSGQYEGWLDYCAVLWDTAGNEKCVARYNGDGDLGDHGVSITFDTQGNFIVTGHALHGTDTEYDITTLKYDTTGTPLWEVRYDGPVSQGDYATKVIADSQDNVVVCGTSRGGYGHRDYVTLKYDPDGQLLWSKRYNGPGFMEDYSTDMILDRDDNIYVTGRSKGSQQNYDIATVKYTSEGILDWAERFDGFWGTDDEGYDLTLDESGNVYVIGTSFNSEEFSTDIVTLKYTSGGTLLWRRYHSGLGQGEDRPAEVGFDDLEGLYLTGITYGGPDNGMDFLTLKYKP
jgi:uncharacterized delta-60 repeat protein